MHDITYTEVDVNFITIITLKEYQLLCLNRLKI
jgi:hypothetical protein